MGAVLVLQPDQAVDQGEGDGWEDGCQFGRALLLGEVVQVLLNPVFQRAVHGLQHQRVVARVLAEELDDVLVRIRELGEVGEDFSFFLEDLAGAGGGGGFDGVEGWDVRAGAQLDG